MATNNEPGSAVLAIFDQLINRVKQSRPVRSDGKPLGGGVVYSMMILGMPVEPADYLHPWSPMGGASAATGAATGAAAAPIPAAPAGTAPGTVPPDPRYAQALEAAYKTAMLCNTMLQVTTDGSYLEYPVGRHLDSAYEGVITAMQPLPMPPIAPDIQKQINDSQAILYELDPDDGSITGKSKLYKMYEKNAAAYALAKANYAIAQAQAKTDPAKAEVFPMTSATFQAAVDDAYDTFKTEGAEKVERALDIIGSVGICLQDHMIKKARQQFDVFNLGLAGVPAPIPYSFIEPSGWCDPDDDDDGWQQLSISQSDIKNYNASGASSQGQNAWMNRSSSTGGGAVVSFGFAAAGGSGGSTTGHTDSSDSGHAAADTMFKNTATGLDISLEYALCTISRPWLISDLFYMQNWYIPGQRKNTVSDGTQANQANITDIAKLPFLPMIPQQMLVIRNVVITAKDWGSDGDTLSKSAYGAQASTDSSSMHQAASGGFSLGFVSFGGTEDHSSSKQQGQGSNWNSQGANAYSGTKFDGSSLKIPGAQIIAFLSDIVPACPPLDDPNLPKPDDKKTGTSANTLQVTPV